MPTTVSFTGEPQQPFMEHSQEDILPRNFSHSVLHEVFAFSGLITLELYPNFFSTPERL